MKKKSLLTLALSLSLVAVVGVGSTLAYLSKESDPVTNTFTVGGYAENALELNEARVKPDENSNWVEDKETTNRDGRTTTLAYEGLIPGSDVFKDPTVQLTPGIESYVFVHITGVDALEDAGLKLDRETNCYLGSNWKKLTSNGDRDLDWDSVEGDIDGYYVYHTTVDQLILDDIDNPEDDSLPSGRLFMGLEVDPTISEVSGINNKQIKIIAAAVQADGIEGATPEKTAFSSAKVGLDKIQ